MNYYELLNVTTEMPSAEIQSALDQAYDQWRALVTHHDPQKVAEANQKLETIELIRGVLLDPGKRSEYDQSLLIHQADVGGLYDPDIPNTVDSGGMSFSGGRGNVVQLAPPDRVDGWVCSNCDRANPVKTRFCKECGTEVGITCPKCGTLTQADSKYCDNCGADIEEARAELERETRRQAELQRQEAQLAPVREKSRRIGWSTSLWWWIHPGIGFFVWIYGYILTSGILRDLQGNPDLALQEQARTGKNRALVSLMIVFLFIVCSGIVGIIQSF
ncbi:MAG: zinc ribbon domain-containing protein [Anaerolineaceae bacterium]|jgi:RNA polymerase subunit RPABC4/transcription elongation factor Spt4|nr:zinc ribbon domain-containing protein [Anaerolineaceae bacterium]MDD4043485.1 zinc ribbon domain-containing protein [Anaerolineaceae bacterium]